MPRDAGESPSLKHRKSRGNGAARVDHGLEKGEANLSKPLLVYILSLGSDLLTLHFQLMLHRAPHIAKTMRRTGLQFNSVSICL